MSLDEHSESSEAAAQRTNLMPKTYKSRDERIRTSDLLVPNEARYQAALRPD